MPKQFKSVMGQSFESFLEELYRDPLRVIYGDPKPDPDTGEIFEITKEEREYIRGVAKLMEDYTNHGICAKPNQYDHIKECLMPPTIDSPEEVNRNISKALNFVTDDLSPLINTFRVECAHCLNAECKNRDPDFPLSSVEEVAEKLNKND